MNRNILSELRFVVMTCDTHAWLLKGFTHQWDKYSSLPIDVAGFARPPRDWMGNKNFLSMGKFSDYPAQKFSDALRVLLEMIPEPYICIFLEDFWLVREMRMMDVYFAYYWMRHQDTVVRMDLTADRLHAGGLQDVATYASIDIIEAGNPQYSLSFQCSIYHRERLLSLIRNGETAQEMELFGSARLNESGYRVYGTRQFPVRYQLMYQHGSFSWLHQDFHTRRLINDHDVEELQLIGADIKVHMPVARREMA